MKLLFYITKGTFNLYKPYDLVGPIHKNRSKCYLAKTPLDSRDIKLNGTIAAECDCELVEFFTTNDRMNKEQIMRIAKDSCLTFRYLVDYESRGGNCRCLYGIHLRKIFMYFDPCKLSGYLLKKAPQNMCVVHEIFVGNAVLISIHPEQFCKIANGNKTIEVRRKIVKDLKELIKCN